MSPKVRTRTEHPDIFKYQNGVYYARFTFNKERHEFPLNTKNFAEAKSVLREKIRTIEFQQDVKNNPDAKRVENVLPDFIKAKDRLYKAKKLRKRSLDEYTEIFERHLAPWFKYKKLKEITSKVWDKYVDDKGDLVLTNHRKVFGNFLRWCETEGYITGVPKLDIPEHKAAPGIALTEEQVLAIISNVQTPKLMVFCLMYLYMAMRSREITALEWKRVHFEKRSIFLDEDHTKTAEARWVPMHPQVYEILLDMKASSKSAYVMPKRGKPSEPMSDTGIYKSFNTAKRKAGIDWEVSPHDFRHTWTTEAHNDPSLTDSQRENFAGSKTIMQKGVYVHTTVERLRPLAEVVKMPAVDKMLAEKRSAWGKRRGKSKNG